MARSFVIEHEVSYPMPSTFWCPRIPSPRSCSWNNYPPNERSTPRDNSIVLTQPISPKVPNLHYVVQQWIMTISTAATRRRLPSECLAIYHVVYIVSIQQLYDEELTNAWRVQYCRLTSECRHDPVGRVYVLNVHPCRSFCQPPV